MSKRPEKILIEDIWESIEKIDRYVSGMSADFFMHDDKTVDAVVRNLEIIGEAANRLPAQFKKHHGLIEWSKIVGLRHRIVHQYFGIDREIIWEIVASDLPVFKSQLERIREIL